MAESMTVSSSTRRPKLSMAQTLSLITVAIVTAALGTATVVVWTTLTRSAVATAQDRADRAIKQLVTATEAGLRAGEVRYHDVGKDTAIAAALMDGRAPQGRRLDAVHAALTKLQAATDSGLPIELWNAHGKRIAFVGDDQLDSLTLRVRSESSATNPVVRPGLDSLRNTDAMQMGSLYRVGTRTFLWNVVAVRRDSHPIGFIAKELRVAANPQTERTVRELTGNAAIGYYRNADGSTWTTFGGAPAKSPATNAIENERFRPGVGPLVFAERMIDGTPLMLVMEMPRAEIIAGSAAIVRRLVAFSVLLILVSMTIAFVLGRRIARPLGSLTEAADAIATGDYSIRVPENGSDEVRRLAVAFNRMASEVGDARSASDVARHAAESANRAKTDFLAAMSHELRTPLNAIGGYAELIEMGLRGPITEEQQRDLARIRASQAHLLGLIGSVLDLNRIENNQVVYDLSNVAVHPLLAGMEALILPQAEAKQQRFEYQPAAHDLVVWADREKLRQVVLNLLSNAVRHSPLGASITLSAEACEGNRVAIAVRDSGGGIPPERQQAIFEPFVQLDRSLTNSAEGVGLGLAISRDLARGMAGDLSVNSTPGQGATFVVTLPAGVFDSSTMTSRTLETPAVRRV